MTVRSDGEASAVRFPSPSNEDLPSLARLAWRLSAQYCGNCRNYHVTWPFLRSIGANGSGPEYRWEEQRDALAAAVAGQQPVRWLLGGAADAGLLALAAAVMEAHPGVSYRVTVVDRCRTPLGLCQAYGEANGIDLETVAAELGAFERETAFDIIVLHHTMVFFSDEEQAAMLRRMANWLAPGGCIYMTFSHDPPGVAEPPRMNQAILAWREGRIRAAAASGEAEPPEELESFIDRLRTNRDRVRGPEQRRQIGHYLAMAENAGLDVERIVQLPKATTDPVPEWQPRDRVGMIARKRP